MDVRVGCFWTVVLEKTLENPLDCKEVNLSILKEINLEYSLKILMLKLKLQSFGHLMWSADSLEKTLMLGKIEYKRRRGWQRMRQLDSITNSMDMNLSNSWREWRTGKPGELQSTGLKRVGYDWGTEQQLLPLLHLQVCSLPQLPPIWRLTFQNDTWQTSQRNATLFKRPIISIFPVREKLNHCVLITDHISNLLWRSKGHTLLHFKC